MDPGITSSRNDLVLTVPGLDEYNVENGNASTFKIKEEKQQEESDVKYGIDDVPSWYLCILMGLQNYFTMIGSIMTIPFILTPALCMHYDDPARSDIICTMIFVTGIVTWVQATFGCRLPIVQGGTISLLVPTLAVLNLPELQCPAAEVIEQMSAENRTELWQSRMRVLSGAISVAAILQVAIGVFGIVGVLVRYVTPLTIVPTVSLIGLSFFENAANAAMRHWGIAAGTVLMLTVFSQVLKEVHVPLLTYTYRHGFKIIWFQFFKLFPVLLTVMLMWGVCGLLTITGHLPEEHPARTDFRIKIVEDSPWFRIPYPGQWGVPKITPSGVLGMMAGVLACTVQSISFYPTTARLCDAPPPPVHVINRGIVIEGLGTIVAGLFGTGNGTNTFGENVAAIGVTKIGSRRVIQYAAILMMVVGLVTKFGAVFVIIPQPIVGGMFCVMFGIIVAFGLSALQYVNLNSSRNLYIVGFSVFFSMVLTRWVKAHPDVIKTGSDIADNTITVLLSTSILIGGIIGCVFDHIIPGTPKDRGLIAWREQMQLVSDGEKAELPSTYDFPVGMEYLRRHKFFAQLPFMPTYKP